MASRDRAAILMVMIRAPQLRSRLTELARLRDPSGVLSITVGLEPRRESNRTPGWQIELRNDLARVREETDDRAVLEQRLAELDPLLDSLREHASPDRGRALYVALRTGEVADLALPVGLPTRARLGEIPHLLPLVAALADGERAGLVSASKDRMDVLESELGTVRALPPISLEPEIGDWWPEMKGPAAPNPARGQQVVSQRDRYARRLADAYSHRLEEGSHALARVARRRRWTRAVLAGDPGLTRRLEKPLAPGITTITSRANLHGLSETDVRARLRAQLARLAARQTAAAATEAIAADQAGGPGVTGLTGTLAALAAGRVDRLLIDPERTYPGTAGADGTLTADEDGYDLTDWIVAAALVTNAEVLPVDGEAAEALAGASGIGALLRW